MTTVMCHIRVHKMADLFSVKFKLIFYFYFLL